MGKEVDVIGSSIDHESIRDTQDVVEAQSKPRGQDHSSLQSISEGMRHMVVGFNPHNTDIHVQSGEGFSYAMIKSLIMTMSLVPISTQWMMVMSYLHMRMAGGNKSIQRRASNYLPAASIIRNTTGYCVNLCLMLLRFVLFHSFLLL